MALCPYCGQEEEFELLEVWSNREFMISTWCEASEEEARWGLAEDPEWARATVLGIEEVCGETLRRVTDDGCCALILDWQFRLERLAFRRPGASSTATTSTCRAQPAGASVRFCGTARTYSV